MQTSRPPWPAQRLGQLAVLALLAACSPGGARGSDAGGGGGGGGGGTPAFDLGSATLTNYGPQRRRLMQVVCLPLAAHDWITAAHPVTVLDPGTGQDERCQVEADWLMPYANGAQRCLRLTFPAVVGAGRTRFEFRRSEGGASPPLAVRGNVLDGLVAAGFTFFAGPRDHFVQFKAPGEPLPEPIQRGTRSALYRWFARIWEPAHAPALRTQMWCELDVEVFHGEDHAAFATRWGCCDPRIDAPDGFDRSNLADEDTQVGFEIATSSPTMCQPVPFFPEQCVVALQHDGARWRWVQDQRNRFQGHVLNDVLPWGICAQASGVLLFRTPAGSLGDPLRDDSLQAFLDLPEPVFAIAETWRARQEAYGPVGLLPRPFKRHEHYDRNRDQEWCRARLESEARVLAGGRSPSELPFPWFKDNSAGLAFHQAYGSGGTGTHGSWHKLPHYPACAYAVPGLGLAVEKYLQAFAVPFAFREADGAIVSAFDHPDLDIDRMSPNHADGHGDLLGKTTLPAWRIDAGRWLIRAPTVASSVAPANEGSAESHFEQPFPFAQAAVFGSRQMRRLAESLTYTTVLGGWQPHAWSAGRTGQPRGLQRGGIMHAWALWLFGADPRLADRCHDVLYRHYYVAAFDAANARLGLPADRLVRTPNVIPPNPAAPQDRVELRFHPYFRPWEDALGVGAWYGIARLGVHLRPELAVWKRVAGDLANDCFRYGTPTEVDAHGRVVYRYLRPGSGPGSVFEPAAAVALGAGTGVRALERAEMQQNNWELCGRQNGNCATSNDGFMRLGVPGSGTTPFTAAAASYVLELHGDARLTRYVQELHTTVAPIPGTSAPTFHWLHEESRWSLAFEPVIFGMARRIGSQPVRRAAGASFSRLGGAAERLWVAVDQGAMLYRVRLQDGAITADVKPRLAPAGGRWSAVQCAAIGGRNLLCVLDGRDPALGRSSYRIDYAAEENPGDEWEPVAFSFADGAARDCTGMAWDPAIGAWLILARRPPAGAEGEAGIWRVPPGGGIAVRDDDRTVIDVDLAQGIDILDDGRLMVITRQDGAADAYALASGGYWGAPRTTYVLPAGTQLACFTRHARVDDALRLVLFDADGGMREVEL